MLDTGILSIASIILVIQVSYFTKTNIGLWAIPDADKKLSAGKGVRNDKKFFQNGNK